MRIKQRIRNYLLRRYLNAVIAEDVITTEKGKIYLGGRPITDSELRQLQAEVKALEGFRLWAILTNSLKHVAHDKVFNRVLTLDDILAGKMMLFTIGTQESILRVLKSK